MFLNESEQVSECVRHAEECAGQAKAQTNPKFQQDFLEQIPVNFTHSQRA